MYASVKENLAVSLNPEKKHKHEATVENTEKVMREQDVWLVWFMDLSKWACMACVSCTDMESVIDNGEIC